MRISIQTLLFFSGITSANIIFTHVPLTCKAGAVDHVEGYTGCLRGQVCLEDNTCAPGDGDLYPASFSRPVVNSVSSRSSQADIESLNVFPERAYSTNGQCGPSNGGLLCDPKSTNYNGGCCSQYGWCGNDAAHCSPANNCISGCWPASSSTSSAVPAQTSSPTAPRADGRCGTGFGNATCAANGPYGGCCSQYGYCGNTTNHCLVSNGCQNGCTPVSTTSSAAPVQSSSSTAPRSDGRCGTGFGNATCAANGPYGGCCSQYGYCGSDAAHCSVSNGCQNGCVSVTSSLTPLPSASATAPRADGRCGSSFGGATCDPKGAYGGCCSSYGYCGTTSQHCLVSNGCQSGCSPVSVTTSTTLTGEPVLGTPTPSASPTGSQTLNGQCGATNNGTVCGTWPQGSCCSMYGFCGNDAAHCGDGCQSGNCTGPPAVSPPGPSPAPANANPGSLKVVGQSGVPAMHAGLLPNGKVFFLDKIENYTQITLPNGQYAYSSEYDPVTNTVVGLSYKTNAFCSSGAFLADGRVINVGGNAPLTWLDPTVGNGFSAIRYLQRSATNSSSNGQPWSEPGNQLSSNRWYATTQILADGTLFVCSGSINGLDPAVPANNNPTWEILSPQGISSNVSIPFGILEKNQPYYMYPFVHLLPNGNLFVFVSKSSELFNPKTNTTVATFPDLIGDYRTYPNTGGSVLLPFSSANNYTADIIICGGGAYQDITSPTDPSCGRIKPLSTNPTWEMDSMPEGRGMVEGTLLPDGTVLFVNGANQGAQGFGVAASPTYEVLIYNSTAALGQRWTTGPSSSIARLYHSVALLLLDGTLMIAGSNPVQMPMLTPVPSNPSEAYVTEFRVEIYTPPYLSGANANKRPTNVHLSTLNLAPGGTFSITFTVPAGAQKLQISLYHGGFVTHSLHMNARMVFLDSTGWMPGQTSQNVNVSVPKNGNLIPPGPYVVYVVVDGVPAMGQFVMVATAPSS